MFHHLNPHIFPILVNAVIRHIAAGHSRFGVRAAWEATRWNPDVGTTPAADDPFKLNDHTTSFFARLLILKYPDLAPYLEIRKSRFDKEMWQAARDVVAGEQILCS